MVKMLCVNFGLTSAIVLLGYEYLKIEFNEGNMISKEEELIIRELKFMSQMSDKLTNGKRSKLKENY
jgi:hypothetical protein